MTALTRVALACGAALIMATAALGALHTDREPAGVRPAPDRPVVSGPEATMPSASELELGALPDGIWATR
jgi:hypothetical protein